jgi:beta-glucosidase
MITGTNECGELIPEFENAPLATINLRDIILKKLPNEIEYTGDKGIKLTDVKSGKNILDEFIAQLNITELEALSHGHYTMDSPLGNKGNAGAFGGITQSLRAKKVPAVVTTDGPSGIRIRSCCSLLPNGTALACSWNTDLVTELYTLIGNEMKEKGSDVLLAPGMNIHRSMLCGRNFEYFSEDPIISGKIASAVVKGVQSAGVSACPKHFACNNQETNRTYNDSRVSERALREIYLKGFEICVKEAKPLNIMTSYNKINGVWGHYHYELCTMILRNEWGYTGNVMTDWWMRSANSHEFPQLRDNAYRVRAGVDVLMPGGKRSGRKKPDGTLLETYKKENGITLGEMQQVARNVLNLCLKLDK